MKLVKQVSLAFRVGSSDKVYEVDLCEVGDDQYVVNFRYGRRGASLRDGSKTVLPVNRAEADKIFDKLVASKVSKGYTESAGAAAPPTPSAAPAPTPTPAPTAARRGGTVSAPDDGAGGPYRSAGGPPRDSAARGREAAILERLSRGDEGERSTRQRGGGDDGRPRIRRAVRGRGGGRHRRRRETAPPGPWPLDRAIWRAGELGISAAEPLLLDMLDALGRQRGRQHIVRRYSLVWALGRCGSAQSFDALRAIYQDRSEQQSVRIIAGEGMRHLYSEADRERFVDTLVSGMPENMRALVQADEDDADADALYELVAAEVRDAGRSAGELIHALYMIDTDAVRPVLLRLVAETPIERGSSRWLRSLFKAAEFRRDGRLFGAIAHRFESADARRNLSSRIYWRRRAWRVLRRLGEAKDPEWVKLAVGVLLPFKDSDAVQPMSQRYYGWSSSRASSVHWGPWAPFWAFNHLLYTNSRRYFPDTRGKAFRQAAANTHHDDPDVREEAFPELWDDAPFGLMHLLDESACEQVHRFAVKALRVNTAFCASLDVDALVMLLSRPYEPTARLGFELAESRYNAANPDFELVAAVACCAYPPARRAAQRWIERDKNRFVEDGDLVAALVLCEHEDTRHFARDLLRSAILSADTARAIIGRIVAALLDLGDSESDNERAADVAGILLRSFSSQLAGLGLGVIRDLIKHPLTALHELAGDILLNHAELASRAPNDVLVALLGSPSESVRGIGARLVGQLPDDDLAERPELLYSLSTHVHADLRAAIRPVLGRLAQSKPAFAKKLAAMLLQSFAEEAEDGVHSHVVSVLREELLATLADLPKEEVWRLLHSKRPQAQELGGVLLASNISPDELTIKEIVRLGSHEILSVREACFAMCRGSVERLKRSATHAVRLVDSRWPDTRNFAFELFREHFSEEELTPEILVGLCDSVREDVQAFGREMITRYFKSEHGADYLLKLSEHPAEALQIFATNYLARYAAGNIERLAELEPFFVTVLSRVNKGRVAKARVLAFLRAEAAKDEAAAKIVGAIFARQSVTIAIGDRARLIEGLLGIHESYPELETPLSIIPPPARQRSGGETPSEEGRRGV